MEKLEHPVPVFATVSRKTGEINIGWNDDEKSQELFGRILTKYVTDSRRDAGTEAERSEAI